MSRGLPKAHIKKANNLSAKDNCFPDKLKFAKVIPLHKGKSTMNCTQTIDIYHYYPFSVKLWKD